MSFSPKSLVRSLQLPIGTTAGAASSRMSSSFDYGTDDAGATVETAGYFNGARARLAVGDRIRATLAAGGTPIVKSYVVLAVPATGNVTIGVAATAAG